MIHNRIQAVELERENDLRLALEDDEFFLVYQPQTDIASGEITGQEALIGWSIRNWDLCRQTSSSFGVIEN